MALNNTAVRLALIVEFWTIRLLLMLPFDVLPYSKSALERQLIGLHWMLNKGISIPEEAARVYVMKGKILLALLAFMFIGTIIGIAIEVLG